MIFPLDSRYVSGGSCLQVEGQPLLPIFIEPNPNVANEICTAVASHNHSDDNRNLIGLFRDSPRGLLPCCRLAFIAAHLRISEFAAGYSNGADAQAGVPARVVSDRRFDRLGHQPAWPRSPGSGPYHPEPAAGDAGRATTTIRHQRLARASAGGQRGIEALRRRRMADREARHQDPLLLAKAAHRHECQHGKNHRRRTDGERRRGRLLSRSPAAALPPPP